MRFEGIIPAVTTPFDASGAVDVAALEENAGKLLEAGVHGFVATGTMGEAGSLSAAEHRMIYEAIVDGNADAAAFYATQHLERVRRYMTHEQES